VKRQVVNNNVKKIQLVNVINVKILVVKIVMNVKIVINVKRNVKTNQDQLQIQ
jgi:hypothetical protein